MIKPMLLLSFLLIASCADRLYGPKLINNHKNDLYITTYYSDDKVFSGYLSNCQKSFIGWGGGRL